MRGGFICGYTRRNLEQPSESGKSTSPALRMRAGPNLTSGYTQSEMAKDGYAWR